MVPHVPKAVAPSEATAGPLASASPRDGHASLGPQVLALVRLRMAQLHDCPLLLEAHAKGLPGLSTSKVSLGTLAEWRVAECFTDRERAALGLAEALSGTDPVVDSTALRAQFSDAEIDELYVAIRLMDRLNRASDYAARRSMHAAQRDAKPPASWTLRAPSPSRAPLDATQPLRIEFQHMHTHDELLACYAVLSELRPAMGSASRWVERAIDMKADGYRVLAACLPARVVGVAGYRVAENLPHGRFIQVEDLVTARDQRGEGIGAALLEEIEAIGMDECCQRMIVGAPASNQPVHRFLTREGLSHATVGFIKTLEKSL